MRFRKKPDEIEAIQWSGSNWHAVLEFCGQGNVQTDGKDVFLTDMNRSDPAPVREGQWIVRHPNEFMLKVTTDEVLSRDWEPVEGDVVPLRR